MKHKLLDTWDVQGLVSSLCVISYHKKVLYEIIFFTFLYPPSFFFSCYIGITYYCCHHIFWVFFLFLFYWMCVIKCDKTERKKNLLEVVFLGLSFLLYFKIYINDGYDFIKTHFQGTHWCTFSHVNNPWLRMTWFDGYVMWWINVRKFHEIL